MLSFTGFYNLYLIIIPWTIILVCFLFDYVFHTLVVWFWFVLHNFTYTLLLIFFIFNILFFWFTVYHQHPTTSYLTCWLTPILVVNGSIKWHINSITRCTSAHLVDHWVSYRRIVSSNLSRVLFFSSLYKKIVSHYLTPLRWTWVLSGLCRHCIFLKKTMVSPWQAAMARLICLLLAMGTSSIKFLWSAIFATAAVSPRAGDFLKMSFSVHL